MGNTFFRWGFTLSKHVLLPQSEPLLSAVHSQLPFDLSSSVVLSLFHTLFLSTSFLLHIWPLFEHKQLFLTVHLWGGRLMCVRCRRISKDTHYKEETQTHTHAHTRTEDHLTSSQISIRELLFVIRLNSALDVVTEVSSWAVIFLLGLKRFSSLWLEKKTKAINAYLNSDVSW